MKMKKGNVSIAISILVAGLLIAGAVLFSGNKAGDTLGAAGGNQPIPSGDEALSLDKINPITDQDHVRGNRDAKIKIVEYSDIDCPYCSIFHETMKQVVADYGDKVAWVYRHFPLSGHPNAGYIAMVSECVAKDGGEEAFWNFLDLAFAEQDIRTANANKSVFDEYVSRIGLNPESIKSCVESGEFEQKISANVQNAVETGGNGTPWSIIVGPNNELVPVNGALPYESVKAIIDQLLAS